jgi:hypothetical protein
MLGYISSAWGAAVAIRLREGTAAVRPRLLVTASLHTKEMYPGTRATSAQFI